jgi:hypothetical protein
VAWHPGERDALRGLAKRRRDHAVNPIMAERKRLWTAVRDLKPVRPMVLVEPASVEDFAEPGELRCQDPFLVAERHLRDEVRHADEVGDDIVLEQWFRFGWQMPMPDFE